MQVPVDIGGRIGRYEIIGTLGGVDGTRTGGLRRDRPAIAFRAVRACAAQAGTAPWNSSMSPRRVLAPPDITVRAPATPFATRCRRISGICGDRVPGSDQPRSQEMFSVDPGDARTAAKHIVKHSSSDNGAGF